MSRRTHIAPRTYVDPAGRYWARYPVNKRYTWRLLKDARGRLLTSKRAAIAAAQKLATNVAAPDFQTLAQLYLDSGCKTKKLESRPEAFLPAETKRVATLLQFFNRYDGADIRLKLLPQYAEWRMRRVKQGTGERTVDKELCTLSNILNYAVVVGELEFNWISRNRGHYRKDRDIRHSHVLMPASAEVIHQLAGYHLATIRSEVFAWLTFFAMFTGCRTSELLRLRMDAENENEAGYYDGQHLYLGRRSKGGFDPWSAVGPEFSAMVDCFIRWHETRWPKSPHYFPSPNVAGAVVGPGSHGHALTRACHDLALPHTTPHALRAYYVTKRRREGARDSDVAAEIGDATVSLISSTYGRNPKGPQLHWTPTQHLPAWLVWQPDESKITQPLSAEA